MRLPKQCSFKRSLSPSHAIFMYEDFDGKTHEIPINETKIIGQKGHSTDAFDSEFNIKENITRQTLAQSNPQTVDLCFAPPDSQKIVCRLSLRVNAHSSIPFVCSDQSFVDQVKQFSQAYQERGGYAYLANRYLMRIFDGSWLWRNKDAPVIDITVKKYDGQALTIRSSLDGTIRLYTDLEQEGNCAELNELCEIATHRGFTKLCSAFEQALVNPKFPMFFDVKASIKHAFAQEIHPSQVFLDKDEKNSSRVYQRTRFFGTETPILGTYKVGAALACIDNWHPNAEKVIRVGAYGVDKQSLTVHRHPDTQKDIYTLLRDLESITKSLYSHSQNVDIDKEPFFDAHFVAANLIKGGLLNSGK